MEWTQMWLTISSCWILFLLILTIYWLQNGRWLASLVALVLIAVEVNSVTPDLEHRTPAASFVIAAAWYNQALYSMKQCMAMMSSANQATTSAFTTGMSAFHSCFSWNPKSLMTKCWLLRKSSVTARTPFSTKILSDQFSDL